MVSQDNQMTGKIRLYIFEDLSEGRNCSLIKSQHHYLRNVMRCQSGEPILVFNGRDGEWLAEITQIDKKAAVIQVLSQTRLQSFTSDI
ncbi:MAG: RNA methyltransferase PUA domain-containing protein, partial [Pseudomonadota bacterium]|nr:RNA methyltransferase PUA domain-containing protein [Pseudomonadota bacterium]